eukprot:scaffold5340_cov257-Pinguiococcus_pyrenoidosus.AAC.5
MAHRCCCRDSLRRSLTALDSPQQEMYVYNTETDAVRTIVILPTNNWGGDGTLGASVGHGYLHRLPERCLHTPGRNQEMKLTSEAPKSKAVEVSQAPTPVDPIEDEV